MDKRITTSADYVRLEENGINDLSRGWEGTQRGNDFITSEFFSMPKRPSKFLAYDKI